jgi:two-component system response regulator GlrR
LNTGEHGVGKEVVARHIHRNSRRSRGEFLAVNCGAIPEGLVESELFGHERGSFTGAVKQHRGKFELAAGGTLLLDEITEMPLPLQPILLRVLQTQESMRVGGEETLRADVRVICSTNRDPRQALDEGRLRHDLFYRINAVTLHVPALRERREDVVLLARHFLAVKSRLLGKHVTRFSEPAESLLLSYDWPGNVRELMNAVECAVVFCRTDEIGPELLTPISEGAAYLALPWDAARELAIRRFELSYLSTLLRVNRGSVVRCARAMRMSRQALYKLLERTGLEPSTFRSQTRSRSRK